jgi:biopolymer transport protein ExbB
MSLILQIQQAVTTTSDTLQQIAPQISAPVQAAAPIADKTFSLWEIVLSGGPIMIPIGILSLAGVYIFFERFFTIKKSSKIDDNFLNQIRDFMHQGNVDAAITLCKHTDNPVARMVLKGLLRLGKPVKDIESAIENVGKLEVYKMEKNLSLLGTIAGIAPMFGFLGTIFGVIKIFYNISLADNISIGLIAGGLYEKMVTSAAGLSIGIFAYIGYHYLIILIDRVVNKMEINSVEFIDLLEEPAKK